MMKLSVSNYSFHEYQDEDKLGQLGIIDWLAQNGFEGVEFTPGKWTNDLDPEVAKKIRAHCEDKGVEPVCLSVGANFLAADLDAEIAQVKRFVDFAAQLGCKMMRHDVSGGFTDGRKICRGYDDALPIMAPAIREVASYAEQKGVATMTENHGYFSQDAERVEKLINTVAHPNFGALVDIGNFACADEDPAKSVSIMAPYAKHVHAKDFFFKSCMEIDPGEGWFRTRALNYLRGAIIGQGDAKAYQSIQILKKAGYDGYVSIEFEGQEDPLKGIRIGGNNLRRFIGA